MDRLDALAVFVQVAEAGSFAAAARHLRLSPPAVTRAVAALERRVGARLLLRTTRSVRLTEAGARFLDDSRRILAAVAEAEAAAGGTHATPGGTLQVTAPVLFGHRHVAPILLDHLAAYPAVSVRALFLDRVVNLVEEGVDVAVRIGSLPDSGLSAIRVGTVRRVVCASPAYLARAGVPRTSAELRAHMAVATNSTDGEWRPSETARSSARPRLTCNTNEFAIAAAIAGWGVARVLSYQVSRELADGRLVRVLPEHEGEVMPIHLVHPSGRHATAAVRVFLELATHRLRNDPAMDGSG